jgi:hypothetical protein
MLMISCTALADSDETGETVTWIGWPVVGHTFDGFDVDALYPPPKSRFRSKALKSVRIGLRSDGVVVWEMLGEGESKDEADASMASCSEHSTIIYHRLDPCYKKAN